MRGGGGGGVKGFSAGGQLRKDYYLRSQRSWLEFPPFMTHPPPASIRSPELSCYSFNFFIHSTKLHTSNTPDRMSAKVIACDSIRGI